MHFESRYPSKMISFVFQRFLSVFRSGNIYSEEISSDDDRLARERRSVFLRHLDCGSCNGCELELNALSNPIYDSERFGIRFEASPRHADVLMLTGVVTRNLVEAASLTLEAMSLPRQIVTVGDCAKDGGIFRDSYAVAPRPECIERAIVAHVPGCPPSPADILRTLATVRQ